MRAPGLRLASDHDFASGNCDIQADPEQIALMVAPVLALDGNPAGHMIWSKNRSSSRAHSLIRSSTLGEASTWRKVICNGRRLAFSP
jgi:hypothetical protein